VSNLRVQKSAHMLRKSLTTTSVAACIISSCSGTETGACAGGALAPGGACAPTGPTSPGPPAQLFGPFAVNCRSRCIGLVTRSTTQPPVDSNDRDGHRRSLSLLPRLSHAARTHTHRLSPSGSGVSLLSLSSLYLLSPAGQARGPWPWAIAWAWPTPTEAHAPQRHRAHSPTHTKHTRVRRQEAHTNHTYTHAMNPQIHGAQVPTGGMRAPTEAVCRAAEPHEPLGALGSIRSSVCTTS